MIYKEMDGMEEIQNSQREVSLFLSLYQFITQNRATDWLDYREIVGMPKIKFYAWKKSYYFGKILIGNVDIKFCLSVRTRDWSLKLYTMLPKVVYMDPQGLISTCWGVYYVSENKTGRKLVCNNWGKSIFGTQQVYETKNKKIQLVAYGF